MKYQYKHRKPQRKHFPWKKTIIVIVVFFVLLYPFWEAYHLKVEETTLSFQNLDPNLKNLRIVFVSDIYQGNYMSQSRVDTLVHTINNLSADLVLLGGDYAMNCEGSVHFFQNLPQIQSRLGVYAVLGEHDLNDPTKKFAMLRNTMANSGVTLLTNEVAKVKRGKTNLYIAGVDDYTVGTPDLEKVASEVTSEEFVILLSHSPDNLTSAIAQKDENDKGHWFDMALFGHTLGGQIRLGNITPFINISSNLGKSFLSGWHEKNRAHILVSRGVGSSRLPIRLFAPPQIHLITLRK